MIASEGLHRHGTHAKTLAVEVGSGRRAAIIKNEAFKGGVELVPMHPLSNGGVMLSTPSIGVFSGPIPSGKRAITGSCGALSSPSPFWSKESPQAVFRANRVTRVHAPVGL